MSSDTGKGGTDPPEQPTIQVWVLKTAGTIIGGLGTAGAMVVIGSAVLWIRFKEAGIPPVQATSVQPRQEALVQGAQTTLFFVFAALAVVAVLYILDFPKEEDSTDDKDQKRNRKDREDKREEKKSDEDTDPGDPRRIRPRTKRCILLIPIIGIGWLIFSTSLGFGAVLVLSLLAAGLTVACLWIGHRADKNFWALAAAVFASLIVFAGASTFAITQEQKFVQAVAILRGTDDIGLTGYFVAATDSRVYFANAIGVGGATAPERKPLQSVKVSDDVTYSIGPLESQEDATERASSMMRRLIADREAAASGSSQPETTNLPDWVRSDLATRFGDSMEVRTETSAPLCLMRYFSSKQGSAMGAWWTSCAEAEALASIHDVRSHFALPHRFQASYDRRVRVEVPAKVKLNYVEGDTAPQCGGVKKEPCGHRYPGGGLQYWISDPEQLGKITVECTTREPDEGSKWHSCAQ